MMYNENIKTSFCFDEFVGIGSENALIVFDRKSNFITALIHKKSGINLLANAGKTDLFKLHLTLENGAEKVICSAGFRKRTSAVSGENSIVLAFEEHPECAMKVEVAVSADPDGLFHLGLKAEQAKEYTIQQIDFLKLETIKNFGVPGEDDGHAVIPVIKGEILVGSPWSKKHLFDGLYPRSMDVQLAALYTSRAGLYTATYDGNYNYKKVIFSLENDGISSIEIQHMLPAEQRETVAIPYDTILGAFSGDWYDAADLYKKWAVQQKWCEKKITERDDVPQFLQEGAALLATPFLHEYGLKQYSLYPYETIDRYPALARAYREKSGMPHIVFIPMGWENRGAWAGINYFPARPSNEKWQTISAELKQQGDRIMMMPSGFKWVIKRQGNPHQGEEYDDSADFEARKEMMVHNADGTPWFWDLYHDRNCYVGLTAKLCYGSKTAQQTVADIFKQITELGTTLIQFDQEDGGAQDIPCYKASHGHKLGYTNEFSAGFIELAKEIIRENKKIEPEFGLSIEQCGEAVIPVSSIMWARQCAEVDEYVDDCRSIPVFPYIYHEYQMVLGDGFSVGVGMWATLGSYELRCFRLANAVVRGLLPTIYMEQVELDAEDEWTQKVSEAFVAFCRPVSRFREYLLLGKTRRPWPLKCAMQSVWHYALADDGELFPDGRRGKKVFIDRPAVVDGTFEAEDGSLATIVINSTFCNQDVEIVLPENVSQADIYSADRELLEHVSAGTAVVKMQLEPLGVKVIICK